MTTCVFQVHPRVTWRRTGGRGGGQAGAAAPSLPTRLAGEQQALQGSRCGRAGKAANRRQAHLAWQRIPRSLFTAQPVFFSVLGGAGFLLPLVLVLLVPVLPVPPRACAENARRVQRMGAHGSSAGKFWGQAKRAPAGGWQQTGRRRAAETPPALQRLIPTTARARSRQLKPRPLGTARRAGGQASHPAQGCGGPGCTSAQAGRYLWPCPSMAAAWRP